MSETPESKREKDLQSWNAMIEEFDEIYKKYCGDEHKHEVQTSESETGEWVVELSGYNYDSYKYTDIIDYCASREIAVEEAVIALCDPDSNDRAPFGFVDYLTCQDGEELAKRLGKTEDLKKLHDKLREVVVCKECYEQERWCDKFAGQDGPLRTFVMPRPLTVVRTKKRRLGFESEEENK